MQQTELLYRKLFLKAEKMVQRFFGTSYSSKVKFEIAHDITVDFLFFSKSFRKTYDFKKGKLLPFFSSYVQKRSYGIRERIIKRNQMRYINGEGDLDTLMVESNEEVGDSLEGAKLFKRMREILRNLIYTLSQEEIQRLRRTKRPVIFYLTLEEVLVSYIDLYLQDGSEGIYENLALDLWVTKDIAERVVECLRGILRERLKDEYVLNLEKENNV